MTILDCIWNSKLKRMYVLDVLMWNGLDVMHYDVSIKNFQKYCTFRTFYTGICIFRLKKLENRNLIKFQNRERNLFLTLPFFQKKINIIFYTESSLEY